MLVFRIPFLRFGLRDKGAVIVNCLLLLTILGLFVAPRAFGQNSQIVLENERVRVLRVVLPPHEKTSLDVLPEFVAIYLTPAQHKITATDGKVQEIWKKKGDTLHGATGARGSENLSDQLLEFVIVEVKKKPAGAPYEFPPSTDPAKIDPKYHTVDFENDRVRVLRTVLPPHIKSPMHTHPAYVVVYLTDLRAKMRFPDGTEIDNVRKRGQVAWRDALQHSTENIEEQDTEEIQVELR